jgi:hypothetical protein
MNTDVNFEKLDSITRVEIIEEGKGRVYVNFDQNNEIEISVQDDLQTLKIFIRKKEL